MCNLYPTLNKDFIVAVVIIIIIRILKARVRRLKARLEAIKPRIKQQTYKIKRKIPSSKYQILQVTKDFNFFHFNVNFTAQRLVNLSLDFFSISVFFYEHSRFKGQQEGGRYRFNYSLPFPPTSQTLRHQPGDYCRELNSAHSQQRTRTGNNWFPSASR